MTKRSVGYLWLFTVFVGVPVVVWFSSRYGSSSHPFGMAFWGMAMGAILVMVITLYAACFSSKPLSRIDIWRVLAWTLFGAGLCHLMCFGGYYDHFYPQYGPAARCIACALAGFAGCGILLTLFLQPREFRPGLCRACGYDLTGNVSGVCPECGAAA